MGQFLQLFLDVGKGLGRGSDVAVGHRTEDLVGDTRLVGVYDIGLSPAELTALAADPPARVADPRSEPRRARARTSITTGPANNGAAAATWG